jgi:hypothetical protein
MKLKEIQDTISQILVPDASGPDQTQANNPVGRASENIQASVAPLKLPSTFVSSQTSTDQLQLNADNSFSLKEGGQSYSGMFLINSNSLELNIKETGVKTSGNLQGNTLTDSSGQKWVLREQATTAAAPAENVLYNQDIIALVKAGFDDPTILAAIASARCQFDTSTSALINLKQSKVSAAVIKAMVGAQK